jgi:hypothetical protein
MATLAEQRIDDKLKGKESGSSLDTSKADGHISTQESLNESNREPKTLGQHISISKSRTHLNNEDPVESRAESREVHTPLKNDSAIKKHPFILSSRAEFDEGNMFAAARKAANDNVSLNQDASIREYFNVTNKRIENENQDYNTPPNSNRLRVQTPQSKKAKYIFKRTFDATFNPSNVRGTDIILASDSGEEDN